MPTIHDFQARTIDGKQKSLRDFGGKVLLVVNVASKCGLTPQYTGLEELYRRYKGEGFEILGFPCNDFAGQEPGTEEEIQTFCSTKYDVTFPLFSKVRVLGEDRDPLFRFLSDVDAPPKGKGDVTWNFEKFLVDGNGAVVARFMPPTQPLDDDVTKAVEAALAHRTA